MENLTTPGKIARKRDRACLAEVSPDVLFTTSGAWVSWSREGCASDAWMATDGQSLKFKQNFTAVKEAAGIFVCVTDNNIVKLLIVKDKDLEMVITPETLMDGQNMTIDISGSYYMGSSQASPNTITIFNGEDPIGSFKADFKSDSKLTSFYISTTLQADYRATNNFKYVWSFKKNSDLALYEASFNYTKPVKVYKPVSDVKFNSTHTCVDRSITCNGVGVPPPTYSISCIPQDDDGSSSSSNSPVTSDTNVLTLTVSANFTIINDINQAFLFNRRPDPKTLWHFYLIGTETTVFEEDYHRADFNSTYSICDDYYDSSDNNTYATGTKSKAFYLIDYSETTKPKDAERSVKIGIGVCASLVPLLLTIT
ncbi:hypothetical protein HELRODRAFT_161953 [Helobdella robusta]|uniref:Uncharacterized protein n=1 Tax=Helobdella robusta TaxID=6412 RepID=T1ES29_HELRO|nr:hypothetical protein HELRODRAFT_161953 [Helobdella robusta]ESO02663.1 hypothetical protein HELRODRAFT_161953 [Helobdella robusta]